MGCTGAAGCTGRAGAGSSDVDVVITTGVTGPSGILPGLTGSAELFGFGGLLKGFPVLGGLVPLLTLIVALVELVVFPEFPEFEFPEFELLGLELDEFELLELELPLLFPELFELPLVLPGEAVDELPLAPGFPAADPSVEPPAGPEPGGVVAVPEPGGAAAVPDPGGAAAVPEPGGAAAVPALAPPAEPAPGEAAKLCILLKAIKAGMTTAIL